MEIRYHIYQAQHFAGTSILTLRLADNLLKCIPNLSALKHSLEHLGLSGNQIGDCKDDASVANNVSFSKLGILNLINNKLSTLPSIMEKSMKLWSISLERNQFCWVPNLTAIYRKMYNINLQRNPLCCDCDLLWIPQFLKKWDSMTNRDTLDEIKCNGSGMSLSQMNYSDLSNYCMNTTTVRHVESTGKVTSFNISINSSLILVYH